MRRDKSFRKIIVWVLALVFTFQPFTIAVSAKNHPKLLWTTNGHIFMQFDKLAIVETRLTSGDPEFFMINLDSGRKIPGENELVDAIDKNPYPWLYQIGSRVIMSDKSRVCFDFETGKKLWENNDLPVINSARACSSDLVYVANPDYVDTNIVEIICFKLTTGEIILRKKVQLPFEVKGNGGHIAEIVKYLNNKMVFRYSGRLYCYDMQTEKFIWKCSAFNEYYFFDTVYYDYQNYFIGVKGFGEHCNHDYRIFCLDIDTGKELWSVPGFYILSLRNGYLYYSNSIPLYSCDMQRYVAAVEISTGKVTGKYMLADNEIITDSMANQEYVITSQFIKNEDKSTTCRLKLLDSSFEEVSRIESDVDGPASYYAFHVFDKYCTARCFYKKSDHTACFAMPGYKPQNDEKTRMKTIWEMIQFLLGRMFTRP